jgi:GntR family transcriptional regulator
MVPRLPKYYTISQKIIGEIKEGRLLPGMRVPSENQIRAEFGVSNTTARRILQEVESTGWAVRIKGSGTFVRTTNVERSVTRILGFTRNMIEAGRTPTTKLLDAKTLQRGCSTVVNDRFHTMQGPIYRIERLRFADETPMMLEQRYISLALCPDIAEHDLEQSLYDIYESSYSLQLSAVDQMLSSVMIDDSRTMALFQLEEPIPALLVEGVTFCAKKVILEMERSLYRGDKYRFSVCAQS